MKAFCVLLAVAFASASVVDPVRVVDIAPANDLVEEPINADNAVVEPANVVQNLFVGEIGPNDRVVYRQWFQQPGFPEAIFMRDILYGGSATITAISCMEVGRNPFSWCQILAGGIGRTTADIRIGAARSHGFHYRIEIWGR